ncbi:TIGR00730 family Rossman fold protein [Bartonella sp. DGB1]|uniref:LOG family protein n=1 Tax=Bartonella sp. DGB1 TaxID=3239807 RepID=UPI003524F71E
MAIESVCVYCGAAPGKNPIYVEQATLLGKLLSKANLKLVYGGGFKGIMGAVAKSMQQNGGHVTGIIPHFLINRESSHDQLLLLNEAIFTENMHQRKQEMFTRADAFLALPGGIGTVEEIVEIFTWSQIDQHKKPFIFVNINNYWDPIKVFFEHMLTEGFITSFQDNGPLFVNNVEEVFPLLDSLK